MELDLDTLEQPRTRWLDCGGVRFLVRYVNTKDSEKWRQAMIRLGIIKSKGGLEVNPGREDDWFLALAKQYVVDWDGEIKPAGTKYTPEKMAQVLAARRDVLNYIAESIAETEAFFTESGRSETTN